MNISLIGVHIPIYVFKSFCDINTMYNIYNESLKVLESLLNTALHVAPTPIKEITEIPDLYLVPSI